MKHRGPRLRTRASFIAAATVVPFRRRSGPGARRGQPGRAASGTLVDQVAQVALELGDLGSAVDHAGDKLGLLVGDPCGLVPGQFAVELVADTKVRPHRVVVQVRVFIARQVEAELVDDLGPLPDPGLERLVGDVLVNPRAEGAPERGLGHLGARLAAGVAHEALARRDRRGGRLGFRLDLGHLPPQLLEQLAHGPLRHQVAPLGGDAVPAVQDLGGCVLVLVGHQRGSGELIRLAQVRVDLDRPGVGPRGVGVPPRLVVRPGEAEYRHVVVRLLAHQRLEPTDAFVQIHRVPRSEGLSRPSPRGASPAG
jgi:hypothetical protein